MNTKKDTIKFFLLEVISGMFPINESKPNFISDMIPIIGSCNNTSQLKALLSDILEWSKDINGEELKKLDENLVLKGLPSLSKMRKKDYRKIFSILKNDRIKNESEYRLVTSYLDDITNSDLSEIEIEKANDLLLKF